MQLTRIDKGEEKHRGEAGGEERRPEHGSQHLGARAPRSWRRRISGLELRSAMELALEDNVRLRQSASCKRGVEAFLAKQELDWRLLDRDPSSPIS